MRGLLILLMLASCSTEVQKQSSLGMGLWYGRLELPGGELPFYFELDKSNETYSVVLYNAEERILLENAVVRNDSFIMNFPVYDGQILAKVVGDSLQGAWHYRCPSSRS